MKDTIQIRKEINKFIKECKIISKETKCKICGKDITSACNSHSLPRMMLRGASDNGILKNIGSLMKYSIFPFTIIPSGIINEDKGINESGTFYNICRECDSTIFKHYEDRGTWINNLELDNLVLTEILLKNRLYENYKRHIELEIYTKLYNKYNDIIYSGIILDRLSAAQLDVAESDSELTKVKSVYENINSIHKSLYKIIFRHTISEKVKIAAQAMIYIYRDINGYIINDIYNYNLKGLYPINICIFPFEESTEIIVFIQNKHRRYLETIIETFNNNDIEDNLKYITYLLLKYTEDVYIDSCKFEEIKRNKTLYELVNEGQGNTIGLYTEKENVITFKDVINIIN